MVQVINVKTTQQGENSPQNQNTRTALKYLQF